LILLQTNKSQNKTKQNKTNKQITKQTNKQITKQNKTKQTNKSQNKQNKTTKQLLSGKFADSRVREFAVSILDSVPHQHIQDFLPQLVQVPSTPLFAVCTLTMNKKTGAQT